MSGFTDETETKLLDANRRYSVKWIIQYCIPTETGENW